MGMIEIPDLSGKIYLATIADDAAETASDRALGIELDEFCEAAKMDAPFLEEADKQARADLSTGSGAVLHAPFAEIYPSAVDPLAVQMAENRLNQAFRLAYGYGIRRMVAHGGFLANVYYEVWFHERSVEFWRRFMADKPDDFTILIENVLEYKPELLLDIAAELDDPRIRLCLDTGHAFSRSEVPLERWVDVCAPYLGHVHIHDNDGKWDYHMPLGEGGIPFDTLLCRIADKAPEATFTIESLPAKPSVLWLESHGFLPGRTN